jgi:hypothetical protein
MKNEIEKAVIAILRFKLLILELANAHGKNKRLSA